MSHTNYLLKPITIDKAKPRDKAYALTDGGGLDRLALAVALQFKRTDPCSTTQQAQRHNRAMSAEKSKLPGRSSPLCGTASAATPVAHHELFSSLYEELHRLARREVRRQGDHPPVSATTLIHEAFLVISQRDALAFPDQNRFLAYAGRAMRGLVIDRVRERQALKRGVGFDITVLDTQIAEDCEEPALLGALGEALDQLALLEPELASVVDLKYFCGFNLAEVAQMQGVSERTAQRRWEKARLMLFHSLADR